MTPPLRHVPIETDRPNELSTGKDVHAGVARALLALSFIGASCAASAALVLDGGDLSVTAGGHRAGEDCDSQWPECISVPAAPDVRRSLSLGAGSVGSFSLEAINQGDHVDTYASTSIWVDSGSIGLTGIALGDLHGPDGITGLYSSGTGTLGFTIDQAAVLNLASPAATIFLSVDSATQGEVFFCQIDCQDVDQQLGPGSYSLEYWFSSDSMTDVPIDTSFGFSIVTPVPLPAAAFLFGPALAGLGLVATRRQSRPERSRSRAARA